MNKQDLIQTLMGRFSDVSWDTAETGNDADRALCLDDAHDIVKEVIGSLKPHRVRKDDSGHSYVVAVEDSKEFDEWSLDFYGEKNLKDFSGQSIDGRFEFYLFND